MPYPPNGILAPDGTLHPCKYFGHTRLFAQLAAEIGKPKLLEDGMIKLGYIPLRTGQFWMEYPTVTQRQFDTICEFQMENPDKCVIYVDEISPVRTISELVVR